MTGRGVLAVGGVVGVSEPVLLVLGFGAAVVLAVVAKRLALPFPIVFVVAGTLLAFIPGLPDLRMEPDWIFVTILPPLLFSGGWTTDWVMFRKNLRGILQLAIGLVILTTVVVAIVAQKIVPGLGWAGAFVLGAIVSPPDAVAAIATFERFAVPRRIVAVLEGEGLVNDATALVIYGYAVAAATTGVFSLPRAAGSFVVVALGGLAVGVAVAWAVERIVRALKRWQLADAMIDNLVLLGAPYAAYLSGSALHVSGVLATVTAGIMLSRRSSVIYGPETRLIALNVWTIWIYVLNAFVFLTIGLQLRGLVTSGRHVLALLPAALAISVVLIVVRLLWIYPAAYLPRLIPAIGRRDPLPPMTSLTVIGWTGMRGIVSLAAALALPFAAAGGQPFPGRQAIVFITFVAIFVTLVGQGLSLIPVLRWLHLSEDGDGERREIAVRIAGLQGGLRRIDTLRAKEDDADRRVVLERLRSEYVDRIAHLRQHLAGAPAQETPESRFDHEVQNDVLHAERRAIMRLRDRGEIPDDIFRRVQYDIDLAESRLF